VSTSAAACAPTASGSPGTAEELLELVQQDTGGSSLPERWVLPFLKLRPCICRPCTGGDQGRLCATGLGLMSMVLTNFPLEGPIMATHVSVGPHNL